jgi:hypothetical protein
MSFFRNGVAVAVAALFLGSYLAAPALGETESPNPNGEPSSSAPANPAPTSPGEGAAPSGSADPSADPADSSGGGDDFEDFPDVPPDNTRNLVAMLIAGGVAVAAGAVVSLLKK